MKEINQRIESAQRFRVILRVTLLDDQRIEELARDIVIEQSVEIPYDVIPAEIIERGIVGQVDSITELSATQKQYEVVTSYRCDNTAYSLPQLLNIIFGNISLKRGIKVIGLDLPESILDAMGGPAYGIEGIRSLSGVYNRPLACTALKPVGLSISQLASMLSDYVRGGLDLIKEDHGMADVAYHPFAERVARFQEAVVRTNASTGGNTLFFPMVNGGFDQIEEQFRLVKSLGIKGVLVAPMLVGLDTARTLARRYDLALMAHPSFAGTHFHDPNHGMTPAVLFGTIYRLMGADVSIFPNTGGRFVFTQKDCSDLADALRKPLGQLKPAFPCPAGGMKIDRIENLAQAYGEDAVLLIGGALLQHSSDLAKNAAVFMENIHKHFG